MARDVSRSRVSGIPGLDSETWEALGRGSSAVSNSRGTLPIQPKLPYPPSMGEYEGELSRLVDELNRSARRERTDEKTQLDQLLSTGVQRGASDLLAVAGSQA